MKKFFSLVALLVLLLACCTPKPVAPEPLRTFTVVMHADKDFTAEGRSRILSAARAWHTFTEGRVDIYVEFDLDFDDVPGLKAHQAAHHSVLIPVLSDYPIAQAIDSELRGKGIPLAATVQLKDGSSGVFLIMDRIDPDNFELVVTHELGHVAGLPDLSEYGAIMSGVESNTVPTPKTFMPADLEACRASKYCRGPKS